jgi:hypothetical protein
MTKPITNINYILGKTAIYDISPKTNIGPGSTVKRKKKNHQQLLLRAQETVFNRISCLQFGSLFQRMNRFSDEKPGWWRFVCFGDRGRTQGRKLLGNNRRCISLVRHPIEEVVILRSSQVDAVCSSTERWGSGRASPI